jgi:hypothetical protein
MGWVGSSALVVALGMELEGMLLVLSVLLPSSSADMPLFLSAGVFPYSCWYRLLDMLPLLLVLMDHELDRLKGEGRRPIG